MTHMSITLDLFHFDRSTLNENAPANIATVVFTLETSHFAMPPLKELASSNILSMSVILDTSQSAIGPCEPLGQSPSGDNFRHATTARLNSALEAKTAVHAGPIECVNILTLLAFEVTQAVRQRLGVNDVACQNMLSIVIALERPMPTGGEIAFRGQFQACDNGAFKFLFIREREFLFRREREFLFRRERGRAPCF